MLICSILRISSTIIIIIIIIIVTWSDSCLAAILSCPQLFTHNRKQLLISQSIRIKKQFSLQQKVDFVYLYQLLITRMYSYQCILRLLAFIRLLVVCSRILPRMYPYVTRMLSMCFLAIGTRMCPHVSVCYSYITRMLPLCICVVFLVKIRVNGYRQR